MKIIICLLLSILSGIFGRMGGAQGFNSKWRDIGCSSIILITFFLLFGFYSSLWFFYLLAFGLHWLFLSTYWEWLFKRDNLWFSGFMVGWAILPLMGIEIFVRAILLALIWGSLNKYLPSAGVSGNKRILFWRRDVVEEFFRYFSLIFSLLLLR